MSEVPLYSCQGNAMVFDGTWNLLGGGLSKIWIMHNTELNVHRIVACSVATNEFVVNSTLTRNVDSQRVSDSLVQWRDSNRVNGIDFVNGGVQEFIDVFNHVLQKIGCTSLVSNQVAPPPASSAPPPPANSAPPPANSAPPPPASSAPPPPANSAPPPPASSAPPPPSANVPPPPPASSAPPPPPSDNVPPPPPASSAPPPPPSDNVTPPSDISSSKRRVKIERFAEPPSDAPPVPVGSSETVPGPEGGKMKLNLQKSGSKQKVKTARESSSRSARGKKKKSTLQAVSSSSLPSVSPSGSGREYAAKSLYAEEVQYISDLESLLTDWLSDMKNKKVLGGDDYKTLSGYISNILAVASNFAQSIADICTNWRSTSSISEIFIEYILENFEPYIIYSSSYDNILNMFDKFKKKDKIASYLSSVEDSKGTTLLDMVSLPWQRTVRYEQLIRMMRNSTPDNHVDFVPTMDLYEFVLQFRNDVWGATRRAEQFREFNGLFERNFLGLEEIMEPQRKFICDGPKKASINLVECTWILLFNDCMAFCAPSGQEKGPRCKRFVHVVIPYESSWLTPAPEVGKEAFEIKTPETTILVRERDDLYRNNIKKVASKKKSGDDGDDWDDIDWINDLSRMINDWLTREDNDDGELNKQYLAENPDKRISSYTYVDGSSYSGTWIKAKYEGPGIFTSGNGALFEGNFERGAMQGQGAVRYSNGDYYEGDWHRDLPHGEGRVVYANGRSYTGTFDFGKKVGHGTLTWENGDNYVGEWNFDRMFGQGVLTLKQQGLVYTGNFMDDQMHGTGTLKGDNYLYEGEWKAGQRHGTGTEKNLSGTYVGDWEFDRKTGKGKFTSADGKITYEGFYLDNEFSNKGTYRNTLLGYKYNGYWKIGQKNGKGKEKYDNGKSYNGHFMNDYYHGKGKLTLENGDVLDGNFEYGALQGQGTITYANGSLYEGEIKTNHKHGNGKMTFPNGAVYIGQWEFDQMSGQGRIEYADGSSYSGSFLKNRKHGYGEEITPSLTYTGNWENDTKSGRGVMIFPNGDKYEGEWEKGRKVGKGIFTEARNKKQIAQIFNSEGIMTTPGIKYYPPTLPDPYPTLKLDQ
eukprot:TRINITY_DN927_c0_g2_i2.p1 TRINITY_DN927_c0_g2~~TRINITY_DN927_c0_g2_i2.p1  ORF type:complete len:1091 (-),score=302.30 TRINITY_DN927_c0_g2_i2:16-3288(-)